MVGCWANQRVTDVLTCWVCSFTECNIFMLALKGKLKFEFEFEGCGMPNSLAPKKPLPLFTHNEQHKGDFVLPLLLASRIPFVPSLPALPALFCWAVSYFALFERLPLQRKDIKGRKGNSSLSSISKLNRSPNGVITSLDYFSFGPQLRLCQPYVRWSPLSTWVSAHWLKELCGDRTQTAGSLGHGNDQMGGFSGETDPGDSAAERDYFVSESEPESPGCSRGWIQCK